MLFRSRFCSTFWDTESILNYVSISAQTRHIHVYRTGFAQLVLILKRVSYMKIVFKFLSIRSHSNNELLSIFHPFKSNRPLLLCDKWSWKGGNICYARLFPSSVEAKKTDADRGHI